MNRFCCGSIFSIEETEFYRCIYGGEVILYDKNKVCPLCRRKTDAQHYGEVGVECKAYAILPGGKKVELPSEWMNEQKGKESVL